MSDPHSQFEAECKSNISAMAASPGIRELSFDWVCKTAPYKYVYNFCWLGRPIIQFPQDIMAMQELVWQIKPDVIIETGIAHGGSLIFYASMLELIGKGTVIGIDIDIRAHNRQAIEAHPMFKRIRLIQGSSTDPQTVEHIRRQYDPGAVVMVALDSNHTHEHVGKELAMYAPLVTKDSYLVVFDTVIEDMPADAFKDRPWGVGNNPKTAVHEFLRNHPEFVIDKDLEHKLLITVCPDGFLKRIV